MNEPEKILREAIRSILTEIGPEVSYGPSFTDVFVKPASDTLKVIGAEIGKLSSKAQTMTSVIVQGMIHLFLPGLEADYEQIFQDEKDRQRDIMLQFGDAYEQIDKVASKSGARLAFLLDPAMTLSAIVAAKSPAVAVEAARILGGRNLIDQEMQERLRKDKELRDLWNRITETRHRRNGRILTEAPQTKDVQAWLNHPAVRQAIQSSDTTKKMQASGKALIKATVQELVSKAREYIDANSITDLERKTGRSVNLKGIKQVPDEKDAILDVALKQYKKESKKAAIKMVQAHIDQMKLPGDSPAIAAYAQAVEKIKSL